MRDKVRAALAGLAGSRIVCALSGGGDSVALLHCLLALREKLSLSVSAAHFNHCLRGAESDEDEAFVRQLCTQWGVELAVGRGDPRQRTGESPEEAARNLRYEFLRSQPGLIATAHHAGDQTETVLLNLLRGTGLKGLCGMAFQSGPVIRPMLAVTRAEIRAYLSEHHLPYRTDSSNNGDDALRNRLRHQVVPLLERENPSLEETVTRMTGLLRQDEAYLEDRTRQLLEQARRDGGYDCPTLADAPPVLRRRAIRQLLTIPKPALVHVEQVERLLDSVRGSASVDLPGGLTARREYDRLRLVREPEAGFSPVCLRPGETVRAGDWKISLDLPRILEKEVEFAVKYDMMKPNPAIWVRPRQSGDRLRLSGGQKSVKKLMIDRKIPAALRDSLPVLQDEDGVLAVCGLGTDVSRKARPGDLAWILHIEKEESYSHEYEQN